MPLIKPYNTWLTRFIREGGRERERGQYRGRQKQAGRQRASGTHRAALSSGGSEEPRLLKDVTLRSLLPARGRLLGPDTHTVNGHEASDCSVCVCSTADMVDVDE